MSREKKLKRMESSRSLRLVSQSKSFAYVEAYKALRTNLDYMASANGGKSKVIMITSSTPAEGKSNVAINLAISLGESGKRVILLDCDLRKGTVHRYLRISSMPGITTCLSGEVALSEAVHHFKDLGIDVMTSGAVPSNPSELLGSDRMGKMLQVLAGQYDYVICDTPPVNAVSDATALSRYVDGAVLVVSHNLVSRDTVLAAKAQLDNNNVPILGAILNLYDAKKAGSDGNKVYSYYNYGYGYGTAPSGKKSSGKASGKDEESKSRRARSE